MDNYTLIYNQETGACEGIAGYTTGVTLPVFIPLLAENAMYQEFLLWNVAQTTPLDSTIPDPVIAAKYASKQSAIIANLPSWTQVETACDNISDMAEAKAFLKKLAGVVYWLAKNSE